MASDTATGTQVRAVRAAYDERAITVYQAYPRRIAERAVSAGTFVAPFQRGRMTWIKPSFRWMMYRCGWALKPDQEHVLAVEISRAGFEWALAHASLSHFDSAVHPDHGAWRGELRSSPVRVQWDPERTLSLAPLPVRAVQIGLSGEAVERYVDEWILRITDVTALAHAIHADVRQGWRTAALRKLPTERPYQLPEQIRRRIGADAG